MGVADATRVAAGATVYVAVPTPTDRAGGTTDTPPRGRVRIEPAITDSVVGGAAVDPDRGGVSLSGGSTPFHF